MNKALVWLLILIGSWLGVYLLFKLVAFLWNLVPLVAVLALVAIVGWILWQSYKPRKTGAQ